MFTGLVFVIRIILYRLPVDSACTQQKRVVLRLEEKVLWKGRKLKMLSDREFSFLLNICLVASCCNVEFCKIIIFQHNFTLRMSTYFVTNFIVI